MNLGNTCQSFIKIYFSLISPEPGCMRLYFIRQEQVECQLSEVKYLWFLQRATIKHQYSKNQLFIFQQLMKGGFRVETLQTHSRFKKLSTILPWELNCSSLKWCLPACLLELLHPSCGVFFRSQIHIIEMGWIYIHTYIVVFCLLCLCSSTDPVQGH